MKKSLAFIILNWNNFKDTEECIRSLLPSIESEDIFLVDNASKENEIEKLKQLQEELGINHLILNDKNLGFAGAHNKILGEILDDYDYVFLLNNDTAVDEDFGDRLRRYIAAGDPDMVSCKMINYWNRDRMDNAGHKMLSSGEIIPIGHGDYVADYQRGFENIGACAGAGLYSTKLLKDIGLFDDYFQTGYEDAELGLRAFLAGYNCTYEPGLLVYHKMGQSIKKVFNYRYTLKIQTNIFYTYLKLVHWPVILIGFIPWMLRLFLIMLVDILFWRPRYLKIQLHALAIILFHDWRKTIKARQQSKAFRRIHWWRLLVKQEFFLKRDIQSFYKYIIKGEKSYFEKQI